MVAPKKVASHHHETAHRPHMVYELYDLRGLPLYVGLTGQLPQRLATHARADWWWEVAEVRARQFMSRGHARAEEYRLITELQPRHNVQCTDVGAEIQREGHRRRRAEP